MKQSLFGLFLVLFLASSAQALVIPYGVQNDIGLSTVTGWGWRVAYSSSYSSGPDPMSIVFRDVEDGEYVMLAAMRVQSNTFDVLAAALFEEVTTYTAKNETHVSNGVSWYYNGDSMGFAGEYDLINQNTADILGQDERDRLSWHTVGGSGVPPEAVEAGWRSGHNIGLNAADDWTRMVLVGTPTTVPEPSTFLLLGAGFAALVVVGRRRLIN